MSNTRSCPRCGFNATYISEAMAEHHHPRHSCAKQLRRTELAQRRADRARCAPKRNCQHPRARHLHGTRTAYVRDQCRCPSCTAANTAVSNRLHRERAYGRWKPYIDASPSRAHIASLRAAGIGVDQIAKLTGLSPSHLRGLIYPSSNGKPPFRKIRHETAERILAVPVDDSSRAANSRVDATGTRRRLQALVAIGWAQELLADELGRSPANLRRSMASRSVTARTRHLVQEMYERLWDAEPPHLLAAQRRASAAARAHAAKHHWLPPLAWDDIDDDPDPGPTACVFSSRNDGFDEIAIERAMSGDVEVRLTHAEQVEVVRRLSDRGRSIPTIAAILSTSTRTVSRYRKHSNAA
ncbi:MAG TPA: hypothetical protein VF557_18105 [Jatrophihabitans sp.]|uniref:helix-turn-helix domain containing protein n=1 Tax=Jatrophihabitans sp. TaxID=1932789 RepID=UPI002EE0BEEE